MTTLIKTSRNQIVYFAAEFFWNLGRTFPHAVLTILLLENSLSIIQIGFLQLVYMLTSIIFEFPSGVIADIISRKLLYIISIALILLSYLLIFFNLHNFYILMLSWSIYGFSIALKSGTIENNIVLEIRHDEESLTKFTKVEVVLFNISSIIGAILGSVVFNFFGTYLYLCAIVLFSISFIVAIKFKTHAKIVTEDSNFLEKGKSPKLKEHLHSFIKHFKKKAIIISALSYFVITLFSQPLFQYCQVFYKIKEVPIIIFGAVYTIFQLANIAGALLYEKVIKIKKLFFISILLIIPLSVITIFFSEKITTFLLFPLLTIPFYLFNQFLSVYTRKISPKESISSFSSFLGVIVNLSSLLTLGIILLLLNFLNILQIYLIFFALFSLFAFILSILMSKEIKLIDMLKS